MTPPRQFEGVTTPRTHFDRQVRWEGATAYVALGKFMPKSWILVRLRKVSLTKDKLVVSFEKLAEYKIHAQDSKIHKTDKSHTPKTRTAHSHKPAGSEG